MSTEDYTNGSRKDSLVVSMPGERFTPFTLAKKLHAKGILESASFKQGRERYSLLLIDEAFRLRQEQDALVLVMDGKERKLPLETSKDGKRKEDILDYLEKLAAQNSGFAPHLPVPGAGMGYFGYSFVERCDSVKLQVKPDTIGVPESEFIVGHVYIVFDHYTDIMHLVALNYAEHEIDLHARIEELRKRLEDLDFSYLASPSHSVPFTLVSDEEAEKEHFVTGVERIREHIIAGDLLQAVLSRRMSAKSDLSPLEGYRRLRSTSPSPYLFYIDFGSYTILGASPESLVRVRDGKASIRPIAGTRRRGKNPDEDKKLEQELLADPKERAEHLMLVDLARNDLGRIAEAGSVKVTKNMEPELFSHVMHIVSEVEAVPASEYSAGAVLRAAFPAGTVSGAPKIRAITIISGIESYDRSFYAGAVGYLDVHGGLDTCITIRSALVKDGVWHLQAGAGIVYGSKPEREWEETNEKLAALKSALSGGLE